MKLVSVIVLLFLAQVPQASPLFEQGSGQPLVVSIETDLHKLRNEKADYHTSTDNYIAGSFRLDDKAYSVRLQTRGHNRLSKCTFPPLRVRFKKSEIKKSLLKHNHNLKLVTHCANDDLEMLFREYLMYKLYNLITPYSFQARLLKIRYVDSNRQSGPIDSYAFFIESTNSIEERLGLEELESDQDFNMKTYQNISKDWLNVSQTRVQDAFQHFIRNNDWVIFYVDPPGMLSSANIKFFHDGQQGFPFPYDFDLAGLVTWNFENYQYRYGAENLCENIEMKTTLLKTLSHKDGMVKLVNNDSFLSMKYRKDLTEYFQKYESVEDFCADMDEHG
jgi:hypothetical protein